MGFYEVGEIVHRVFTVRIDGTAGTAGTVTGITGAVYADGVLLGSTTVSFLSLGTGRWRASYSVPSGLDHGTDLALVVDLTAGGLGHSIVLHDQVEEPTTPSAIYQYLQSHPIDVGLTQDAEDDLVSAITLGGVDVEAIAHAVLAASVSEAIVSAGPLDRHSLGTMVLMASNADTTSNDGYITVRHPDTDVALFQFAVVTGAGCPIQSVT